jgi:hypothetical protein
MERTTQFITARSLDRRILASTLGYFMSVSAVCIIIEQISVAVTLELVNLFTLVLCLQFYAILAEAIENLLHGVDFFTCRQSFSLSNKISTFYGTRKLNSVLIRALHRSLSSARSIPVHTNPSYFSKIHFNIILPHTSRCS